MPQVERDFTPAVLLPADLQTFVGWANFGRGVANGTVLISTPGFKQCEAAGADSGNQIFNAYNRTVYN